MNVVFDLGGVVLNWQPKVLLQQVLPQHARDAETAQLWVAAIFQGFVPGADWSLFDLGQIEPDALAQRIAQRTGLQVAEVAALIQAVPAHLAPNPETLGLMQDLKAAGHTLYYLSNMPAPYADELERRHPFFGWFKAGVFSGRVQQMKPHADIFATAAQLFGVDGESTVFIDDVWHNIEAAQRHGWHGVQFKTADQVREALADQFFSSSGLGFPR